MIGSGLMIALCAAYVVIAGVSALERNWPRVLYFVCAAGISLAVLWMSHRR